MPRRAWAILVVLVLVAGVVTVVLAPPGDARDAQNMSLGAAAILGTLLAVILAADGGPGLAPHDWMALRL